MDERQLLSLKGGKRPAEWDKFEAYFTPLPVVLQGLRSIASLIEPPRVVVDLGAGPGGFSQVARSLWPEAEIVAVEARRSEAVHLRRHCDRVIIGDATLVRLPVADLVTSNPPFTIARPFALAAFRCVRPGGMVPFLVRQTWGDADEIEELLRERPPLAELTISGRVSMGLAAQLTKDHFGYQWFLWQGWRPRGAAWRRVLLPRLDSASLGWTARPGTGRLLPLDEDHVVNLAEVLR